MLGLLAAPGSLAREAQTMPGLLDLRRLCLAHSLAKLASLAQTMLSLLGLLNLRKLLMTR